jgi:hypothetical protein
VIATTFRFPAQRGKPVRWFLASDLHLGHVACDVRRIQREFGRAVELGANILVNGDVFDAVTTGDKRFTPGQTIPRITEARDSYRATIEYGAEILAPYAANIRVIGIGNHEEAWLKYRQSEPVAGTINLLNARGANIYHGGIAGFVMSLLDIPSGKGKPLTLSHSLHYHHGAGGDAPITGGLIAANRSMVAWIADTHTEGHRHNKLQREYAVGECSAYGKVKIKTVSCVMTGSYLKNYYHDGTGGALDYTYAESSNHPPKPMGGQFLLLTPECKGGRHDKQWSIRQDYHSALMPT